MSVKKAVTSSVLAALLPLIVAVLLVYMVYTNVLIINRCPYNSTLVSLSSGSKCFTNINYSIIVKGKPYYGNSTIVIVGGNIIPLNFRFIGNQPLFFIWNSQVKQAAGTYVFLTIPDTFSVYMQYVSNVSTEYLIFTNEQYVAWVNAGEKGTSTFSVTGTSISNWFNKSDGCAGYVAVIRSPNSLPFSVMPNETALYAPSNSPTGACA